MPREPVTLVCVFNNAAVKEECLERSIELLRDSAAETELIAIDNSDHEFPTAGAALNFGTRQASHRVVVFAHQDVFLHSLAALEQAAGLMLDDPKVGMVGAVGIASNGDLVGQIRDRFTLIGRVVRRLERVETLDEVLFMARRERLLSQPLSEDQNLAWHAYAVEYAARCHREGLDVSVASIPLTHNSLSINLARLDAAHANIAAQYPEQLPLRTTCGTVGEPTLDLERGSRGRRRNWLRESLAVRSAVRRTGFKRVALVDIRRELDSLIARKKLSDLDVWNLVAIGDDFPDPEEGTRLRRRDCSVRFASTTVESLLDRSSLTAPTQSSLVTGVDPRHLPLLATTLDGARHLLGYHGGLGFWLLTGPIANVEGDAWTSSRARPWGFPSVA